MTSNRWVGAALLAVVGLAWASAAGCGSMPMPGMTGGGSAGGSSGGTSGGAAAGGTSGGAVAGGTSGGATAGGMSGGATAGGTSGGATAGGAAGGSTGGGSPQPDGGVRCGTDGGVCFCLPDGGVVGGWVGMSNPCLCPADGGPSWDRPGEGCFCAPALSRACMGSQFAQCLLAPSPYAYRWVVSTCATTCLADGGPECQ